MGLKSVVPRKSVTSAASTPEPASKPVRRLGAKPAVTKDENGDDISGGVDLAPAAAAPSASASVEPEAKRRGPKPGSTRTPRASAPVADGEFDRAGAKARLKEIEAAAKQSRKYEEAEIAEVRRTHSDARRQLQSEHAQLTTRMSKDLF